MVKRDQEGWGKSKRGEGSRFERLLTFSFGGMWLCSLLTCLLSLSCLGSFRRLWSQRWNCPMPGDCQRRRIPSRASHSNPSPQLLSHSTKWRVVKEKEAIKFNWSAPTHSHHLLHQSKDQRRWKGSWIEDWVTFDRVSKALRASWGSTPKLEQTELNSSTSRHPSPDLHEDYIRACLESISRWSSLHQSHPWTHSLTGSVLESEHKVHVGLLPLTPFAFLPKSDPFLTAHLDGGDPITSFQQEIGNPNEIHQSRTLSSNSQIQWWREKRNGWIDAK